MMTTVRRRMPATFSFLLLAGIVSSIRFDLPAVVSIAPTTTTASSITSVADPLDTSRAILRRILDGKRGGETDLEASDVVQEEDRDDRTDVEATCIVEPSAIFDGSFKEALLYAKQQGRLLIAFIPQKPNPIPSSSKISGNDAKSIDHSVMSSFLSPAVAKAAQQAPPKLKTMKLKNENSGSFVLWCCTGGIASSEATTLLKRIQGGTVQYKNASGQKRPLLLALYPHSSTTIIPRLLTQHHCSPPPSTAKFVEWLQTIRKLNKKYYFKLQKQIQEYQWEQERKHGYQSSIQSDIEMKQRVMREELERKRVEQQEKENNERIQQRRIQLLESLPAVTASASTNKEALTSTIALRFSDGRASADKQQLQRTFTENATIRDVFHWIDAVHEIPYETITLQTMNGKRTFTYDHPNDKDEGDDNHSLDVPLHKAGLGKMIGLRVNIKKPTNEP